MQKKPLILGLILLLMVSMVSPVAFGVTIEESEDTTYLDDISYIYSPIGQKTKKSVDYHRVNKQVQVVNEVSTYIQEPLPNPLGGPIDSAWPMASHDNHHTGLSPYTTASNPGVEKWRYKAEGSVDCGIAIDTDGALYFGDFHGDVTALNPDGFLKWKYNVGFLILTSSPCVGEDGTIYIGSYGGKLNAINPDGTKKWAVNVGGNVDSSPAIGEDGTIYVGHHNNDLVAVNPNGTIKWKFTTGFNVVSDPAISDDGTIIFGSGDEWIYALNPNGTLRWKYKTGNDVKGSASIDDNDIIYIASWDGYLYSLYSNGTLKWRTDIEDGSETTPCFGPDGTIYVSYEKLWAINPSDGSVKWTYDYPEPDEESFLSNPAISADGMIYIGVDVVDDPLGAIYAINSDGTLRWRKYIANRLVFSSPSIAADGTIYIGSYWDNGGRLHAFNEWLEPNNPPSRPILEGNNKVKEGWTYRLYLSSSEPDNNTIQFIIDWGDGETEETVYVFPNEEITVRHTYYISGSVTIRAKSRDAVGAESDWSYKQIEVPYSYNYPAWQWLCERFPLLTQILNLLL
jgi:outer membrane protein assembly factor BamB